MRVSDDIRTIYLLLWLFVMKLMLSPVVIRAHDYALRFKEEILVES